jgi:hypothetical protein
VSQSSQVGLVVTCFVGDDASVTVEELFDGRWAVRLWFPPITVLVAAPGEPEDRGAVVAWFREMARTANRVAAIVEAGGRSVQEQNDQLRRMFGDPDSPEGGGSDEP